MDRAASGKKKRKRKRKSQSGVVGETEGEVTWGGADTAADAVRAATAAAQESQAGEGEGQQETTTGGEKQRKAHKNRRLSAGAGEGAGEGTDGDTGVQTDPEQGPEVEAGAAPELAQMAGASPAAKAAAAAAVVSASSSSGAICETEIAATVSLLPSQTDRVEASVQHMLSKLLFQYDTRLQSVPLSVVHVQFARGGGRIMDEMPRIHFDILARLLCFAPRPRDRLLGRVTAVAEEHVLCLVHNYFSATLVAPPRLQHSIQHDYETNSWRRSPGQDVVAEVGAVVEFDVTETQVDHRTITVFGQLRMP